MPKKKAVPSEEGSNPTASRFPEYDEPKYGEKVQSFAVHDAQGRKRIAYVRDGKSGYPYIGEKKSR